MSVHMRIVCDFNVIPVIISNYMWVGWKSGENSYDAQRPDQYVTMDEWPTQSRQSFAYNCEFGSWFTDLT